MTRVVFHLLSLFALSAPITVLARNVRGSTGLRQVRKIISRTSSERKFERLLVDSERKVGRRRLPSKVSSSCHSKSLKGSKSSKGSGKGSGKGSNSGKGSSSSSKGGEDNKPSCDTELSFCSCPDCTEDVLLRMAGEYTCGARMEYLLDQYSGEFEKTRQACARVAGLEFPDVCGECDPFTCNGRKPEEPEFYCGCESCDRKVWKTDAGGYTCGARIKWAMIVDQKAEKKACKLVAEQYPQCNGCNYDKCNQIETTAPTEPPPTTYPTSEPPTEPLPAPKPTSSPKPTPAPKPTSSPKPTTTPDDTKTPAPSPPASDKELLCGCSACSEEIWDTDTGDNVTCGARITWLVTDKGMSQLDACRQIAYQEFPEICGPECDPDRCGMPANPPTLPPSNPPTLSPANNSTQCPQLTPESDLYCFRSYSERERWENVWGKYTVESKRHPDNSKCAPNDNRFSEGNVMVRNDELTLRFKKSGNDWVSSEVRVVDEVPYTYGHFEFSVKSVSVLNTTTNEVIDKVLPPDLVLGMFTFDPSQDCAASAETYYHEVDVELSRWGINNGTNLTAGEDGSPNATSAMDGLFIVQPPESPNLFRFFTGTNQDYNQGGQVYGFYWHPTNITWHTTAGGGLTFTYTTEQALSLGLDDRIQCLPTNLDVRINLWNLHGTEFSTGLDDTSMVEVVIDSFTFTPFDETGVVEGAYCSKDCQCLEGLSCVSGFCAAA